MALLRHEQINCTVTLLHTTSKKPCTPGVSFGCEGSTMWIGSGCRGKFQCDGHVVTCGFAGLAYSGPRHACTCAPVHFGGTFLAGTGTPSISLPADLIDQGAPLHPRLIQARQGDARFVPGSVNESLTATYAIWNLKRVCLKLHLTGPNSSYNTVLREFRERERKDDDDHL